MRRKHSLANANVDAFFWQCTPDCTCDTGLAQWVCAEKIFDNLLVQKCIKSTTITTPLQRWRTFLTPDTWLHVWHPTSQVGICKTIIPICNNVKLQIILGLLQCQSGETLDTWLHVWHPTSSYVLPLIRLSSTHLHEIFSQSTFQITNLKCLIAYM